MPQSEKSGDRAFEIAFLESLYKRDGDDPCVLGILAALYTESGRIGEGLRLDLRHVELTPEDPSAHYDLACSLSLCGRLDEAFVSLGTALALGFENTPWMHEDPDLRALRADPRWVAFLAEHAPAGTD